MRMTVSPICRTCDNGQIAVHSLTRARHEVQFKSLSCLVEALGQAAVRAVQAADMEREIPSLGILSNMALSWDGVSLGKSMFSRHETLCLIGVTYSLQPAPEARRHRGFFQTVL